MIRDFVLCSKRYLTLLLLLFVVFLILKYYCMDSILRIDGAVMNFVQNHIVNDRFTSFFKVITNLGDVLFFVIVILMFLFFISNKNIFSSMTINLFLTYLFSVVYKNIFRRERPSYNLIEKPSDFSFPSGHTMCSVAFYGFLIYLICRFVKNKALRYILISVCVFVIFIIGFSRIYLNVHFFSDVICGGILGLICLLMFVNYVRIRDII